jgi:hypothetical protein
MAPLGYSECGNPVCGTLGLMIARGKVTFEVTDENAVAVQCKWKVGDKTTSAFGGTWHEALEACCEKQIETNPAA